jgi:hypothetical protein
MAKTAAVTRRATSRLERHANRHFAPALKLLELTDNVKHDGPLPA